MKLSKNILLNNKNKTINNHFYIKKLFNSKDDSIYFRTNNNIFKNKSIKCKIFFGKTLKDDLEFRKMNKKRNLSHNTNERYQTLNENNCNLYTKSQKMKLIKKNKLFPSIKKS